MRLLSRPDLANGSRRSDPVLVWERSVSDFLTAEQMRDAIDGRYCSSLIRAHFERLLEGTLRT